MGSKSDWPTMKFAADILKKLGIKINSKIVSAHRTPKRMYDFSSKAKKNKIAVIIAGAGGSAHLPGMIASLTEIPVIGVPIQSKSLNGLDSLLSIVQMPKGIPVGTVAIGKTGAVNRDVQLDEAGGRHTNELQPGQGGSAEKELGGQGGHDPR